MGKRLTDLQLRNLKVKAKASESIGARGDGTLLFWRRSTVSIEVYYRYQERGKESLIKIGQYKATRSGYGYSLSDCRGKAQELANLRREKSIDLKGYLQAEALEQQQEQEKLRRKAELEAQQGTLKQLCDSYIASLYRQEKKSARQVENAIKLHVYKPFPHLVSKKARDITADDIVTIIRQMIRQGLTTISNRVRGYLSAAYNHGIRADNDPMEQVTHGTRFYIEHNPVRTVPPQEEFERVRERFLNHEEIRRLWHDLDKAVDRISPVYCLLLRFMLATGGSRPEQITKCRWSDIDFEKRTFRFIDRKGMAKPRVRVMPLTSRAIQILEELRKISGSFEWPFCVTGKVTAQVTRLSETVSAYCDYLEAETKAKGDKLPERFTSKDIRTTATNLLIECRVPREQRFLIQSREDGSIESKHYDHSDRLPEKREALKKYDAFLDKILKGEDTKLVDLDQYRQASRQE